MAYDGAIVKIFIMIFNVALSYRYRPAFKAIFMLLNRIWRKYFSKPNANKCLTGDVFSCPYPVKISS